MTDRALKDLLFVPLSVDVLNDERLNFASAVAQLVYFRGLVHAKVSARDGIVSRRSVLGGLFDVPVTVESGDVCQDVVADAIGELVVLGLWEIVDDKMHTYRISGWFKHNDPVEAVENRRAEAEAKKRANGFRSGHKQGWHDGNPREGCPLCDEKDQVRAHKSASAAQAQHSGTAAAQRKRSASQKRLARASEAETEAEAEAGAEKQPPPTRSDRPKSAEPEPVAVVVGREALQAIGYLDATPTVGEERTVSRALKRGWDPAVVVELGHDAAARGADDPRRWWLGAVRRHANSDPPDQPNRGPQTRTPGPPAELDPVELEALTAAELSSANAEYAQRWGLG